MVPVCFRKIFLGCKNLQKDFKKIYISKDQSFFEANALEKGKRCAKDQEEDCLKFS